MSITPDQIKKLAAAYHSETTSIRRHIHANPELSFQEYNTSEYIASKLTEYKIPFTKGIVKTGIVALIEGKNPGKKIIALRADMDALPITEQSNKEYISTIKGVMHACGHDVHSACVLGAAKILNELKNNFEGTIKLIFQPGEEKLPGGASLMIKEGVLNSPAPQTMLAQHVYPSMETGKVGFRNGMYMASTDELYFTIKGKGGHAAMPEEYNNPILIASAIFLELDKYFMKENNTPEKPTVFAIGKLTAQGATNVIPNEVKAEGTFRAMNESWRMEAHTIITKIAQDKATEMGGECEVTILKGYPVLINDTAVTTSSRLAAEKYLGAENVEELPLRMTAEDFAFFSQQVPSCFYRLGTGNKAKGITAGVHTPTFDIDERALETGMGLMAWLTLTQLQQA